MPLRSQLLLVTEGHRLEREDRFARLVHRLDLVLVAGRGGEGTQVTVSVDHHAYTARHRFSADPCDIGRLLSAHGADPDRVGLRRHSHIANLDVIAPRRQIQSRGGSKGQVAVPGRVVEGALTPSARLLPPVVL